MKGTKNQLGAEARGTVGNGWTNRASATTVQGTRTLMPARVHKNSRDAGVAGHSVTDAEVNNSRDRLRALAVELSRTEERERRRFATHLHDNIGQPLAAAQIRLDSLLLDSALPAGMSEQLGIVRELLTQAVTQTRSLTFDLSPSILHELGFEAAVRWLAARTQRLHQVAIDVQSDGTADRLGQDLKVMLFQGIRELLANLVKHANARRARIDMLMLADRFRITVQDDGVGFAAVSLGSMSDTDGGFGLFSLRERAAYLGGWLRTGTSPRGGASIELEVPIGPKPGRLQRRGFLPR